MRYKDIKKANRVAKRRALLARLRAKYGILQGCMCHWIHK